MRYLGLTVVCDHIVLDSLVKKPSSLRLASTFLNEWKAFQPASPPSTGNPAVVPWRACPPPPHTHSFALAPWERPTLAVRSRKFFRLPSPHQLCGVSFGRTQDWHKLSSAFLSHWSSWAECVSHRPQHTQAFHFLNVGDILNFKWVGLWYCLFLWFL